MPTINKDECTFFSCELRVGSGAPITGWTKLEYGFKADHELVRGARRVALGTTTGGLVDTQGSLTLRLSAYDTLSQRPGWMGEKYTMVLVYSLRNLPQRRVVLKGLSFTDSKHSMEEGAKPLEAEMSFIFERVFENGICPLTGETEAQAV